MAKQKKTFEEALARLEEIVTALERGEAPLDKLLALYEEGAGLVTQCNKLLDAAEQTVTRLAKGEDGEPQETLFDIAQTDE
ncbi:MAG: exodeoxyribonuclease VII small subunit [Oscillospiraceae bacterium]|jgi:exodeoxyribonuclease VII small subunit|nr:exodeoxyribonuclease VII small subunit [Oscillospiraceae bacterium]